MAKEDLTAEERKEDHINLSFKAQVTHRELDNRFLYEPLLAAHPTKGSWPKFSFMGKQMHYPIWVSSMTGGTEKALTINRNLAKACKDFGMGMGLGSCRSLLYSDERLSDFDFRDTIGEDAPFFGNLGVAQIEQLIQDNELWRIDNLVEKLRLDGIFVHINPMQEWLQPEGDRFQVSPLITIRHLMQHMPSLPIIVKEVGQGMGKASLRELLQLPILGIEFGAAGGTNFALLEMLRADESLLEAHTPMARIGHSAEQMVNWINELTDELGDKVLCQHLIISGGIKTYLDGYYLIKKSKLPAVYGQASALLKHATGTYQELQQFLTYQTEGLEAANAFLTIRKDF